MGYDIPWSADISQDLAASKVVEAFIELLGEAWDVIKGECPSEMFENDITDKIVTWMQVRLRDAGWWVSQQAKPPVIEYNPRFKSFGFCDITLHIRSKSVIFECKRLNVRHTNGNFASLATPYVQEGMNRYFFPEKNSKKVTPQYPALDGQSGMLGYVMDSNITDALNSIITSIKTHTYPKTIINPQNPSCPTYGSYRFLTTHSDCTGQLINMHHVLLPIA